MHSGVWQRCTTTGNACLTYANIAQATSDRYRTVAGDRNRYIRVLIKVTNDAGTTAWVTSGNRAGPIR